MWARRGSPPSSTTAPPTAERVNHKRVARVMRAARHRRLRQAHAGSAPRSRNQADQKVPDLLRRDFTAHAPNQRYVGDITYLPLADGSNLYLATVIDCYSRRLAGWAVADHMRTELVEDALKAAAATRGSLAGAIFHSDHGSVYTSKDYAEALRRPRRHPVHGRRRSSADNALAESFNATAQTRGPPRPACWPDEADLPPAGLQLADPLQHQATPLLVPLPVPDRLRDRRRHRYAAASGVITPRVQDPGVRPGVATNLIRTRHV